MPYYVNPLINYRSLLLVRYKIPIIAQNQLDQNINENIRIWQETSFIVLTFRGIASNFGDSIAMCV